VGEFLNYLVARGWPPNTIRADAYDLGHFWSFLEREELIWNTLTSERAVDFLIFLRRETSKLRGSPRSLVLVTPDRETMRFGVVRLGADEGRGADNTVKTGQLSAERWR
jgi:hypothetical protein